ncbi:MAG: hypothetical protein HOJ21_15255 [Alphaproteobacteria bacterium]|jgi:hypothetical protein|nr:hypothetical protein [Alphaproteobacteria bacterium]
MTFEEQEIWAVICEHGYFWRGRWDTAGGQDEWRWDCVEDSVIRLRVAESWNTICEVTIGDADRSALPGAEPPTRDAPRLKAYITLNDEVEDDIPF